MCPDPPLPFEELQRRKADFELRELKRESRIPRVLRPGYLGPICSLIVGLGGLFYLHQSGFFERERQLLELRKEELARNVHDLEAEIASFTEEKARLTLEVKELRDKQIVADQEATAQARRHATEVAAWQTRVREQESKNASLLAEEKVILKDLKASRLAYFEAAVEKARLDAMVRSSARITQQLEMQLLPGAEPTLAHLDSNGQLNNFLEYAGACYATRIASHEHPEELPRGDLASLVEAFHECLVSWRPATGAPLSSKTPMPR